MAHTKEKYIKARIALDAARVKLQAEKARLQSEIDNAAPSATIDAVREYNRMIEKLSTKVYKASALADWEANAVRYTWEPPKRNGWSIGLADNLTLSIEEIEGQP